MRKPTDEEMRFREILSYIVYDGYGWRGESMLGESMLAVAEELLEETAWMVEPEDATERLWELAEEIDKIINTNQPHPRTLYQAAEDVARLVEERRRGEH